MARIRAIKPQFFRHSELYDAEKESGLPLRIAYAGLWCVADRAGRFKWKPREIKVEVLPYDDVDFAAVLDALVRHRFVIKYQINGEWFGFIPKFAEHQHINKHEPQSSIPEPPPPDARPVRARAKTVRAPREGNDSGNDDGKGMEGKEVSAEPQAAHAPPVPQEIPVISFPTNRQGEEVPIFRAQVSDYAQTYPAVDVTQELREMRRWLIDNPTKRKTVKGIAKFINTWLSKEQDKPHDRLGRTNGQGHSRAPTKLDKILSGALGGCVDDDAAGGDRDADQEAPRGTVVVLPPARNERGAGESEISDILRRPRGIS